MALNILRLDSIILRAIMQYADNAGNVRGMLPFPTVLTIIGIVSDACGARPTTIQDRITDLIGRRFVMRVSDSEIDVTSAGELWVTVVYPETFRQEASDVYKRIIDLVGPNRTMINIPLPAMDSDHE